MKIVKQAIAQNILKGKKNLHTTKKIYALKGKKNNKNMKIKPYLVNSPNSVKKIQ